MDITRFYPLYELASGCADSEHPDSLLNRVQMGSRRYNIIVTETALVEGIEIMVKAKGWSKSDVFREAVRAYLRQNAISSELAEFERRQAATFREQGRQVRQLRTELQILMAFFDLFARSYYVHTPPVPPEAVDASATSAKLRYERLLQQLPGMFQGVTGLINVSADFDAGFDPEAKETES